MSYTDKDGNFVIAKTAGIGVKVDPTNPNFGWKDLIGQIYPHVGGGTAPVSTLIRGTNTHVRGYAYTTNTVIDDITFHMPHDYVPGTDMFFHIHWTHAGTSISGSLVISWYVTYCKGYNQSSQTFVAEKTITQTIPTANIATYPQYGHFIEEFQLTNNGGDSTHLDTSLLEVDGLIKISAVVNTIPSISNAPAGSVNSPFFLMADMHYQSTQMSTKNKNIPFYT